MAPERGTTRAIGSVTYCFNGFQSVACFRLRKIEIRPCYRQAGLAGTNNIRYAEQ